MGKRSEFDRNERDYYRTFDRKAVSPLVKHLPYDVCFTEPFCGDGALIGNIVDHLPKAKVISCSDIHPLISGADVCDYKDATYFNDSFVISNPPWNRKILHKAIDFYWNLWESRNVTTWLLFDANWLWTKQAKPYYPKIEYIVPVGRVKWIEDSKMSSKDDVAWYKIGGYDSEIRIVS